MRKRSLIAPKNQNVTFVELFFDLVFVFAITQITGLLHIHLDLKRVVQALLIFWLIWWSWQQFTWTLNTIDTTNPLVEFFTLLGTAIAFFMAIAIPEAFGGRSILFGVTYVLTRFIGLYLQIRVSEELDQYEAVKLWVMKSLMGIGSVLIGSIIGGNFQYFFWILAVFLDLFAAQSGTSGEWVFNAGHMAERHGLIVIVALGESLIVAAAGLINQPLDNDLFFVGILSVTLTCLLWWSYFVKPKPLIERGLENTSKSDRPEMVRDAYSLAHFPMIAGIIAYALSIEEAIAHPKETLQGEFAFSLALGIFLFIGGAVFALWRSTGELMVMRISLSIIGGMLIMTDVLGVSQLFIAVVFLSIIVVKEHAFPIHKQAEEVKIS